MSLDSFEQRTNLTRAPPLVPLRKPRAEMQTKNTHLAVGGNDLEKRMARARRVMPFVISNLLFADETDRMVPPRGPERKTRFGGETFDNVGIDRFLKNNQVGIDRVDCFGECLLAACAAEADVVTEQ